jgi:hypothetical protein
MTIFSVVVTHVREDYKLYFNVKWVVSTGSVLGIMVVFHVTNS